MAPLQFIKKMCAIFGEIFEVNDIPYDLKMRNEL